MKTAQKQQIVTDALLKFGIVPSFPPTNQTNETGGADGDSTCPFKHLHTTTDPEPDQPTLRIWLDKVNPEKPQDPSKVFLSCRHTSCQAEVWENLTLPIRRTLDGGRISTTRKVAQPAKPVEVDPIVKKRAEAAIAGKEFTEEILNDPTTLGTSEEDIMALSPMKITKAGALGNPFAQAEFFLSLFPEEELLWIGDPDTAKQHGKIRTAKEWSDQIDILRKSPSCQEAPELWPWPGRLITGSSYKDREGGRNNENQSKRFFVICEADKMSQKDQLRVIRAMIADKNRFRVAYVLYSGSKSYHIGLSDPDPSVLDLAFVSGIPGTQVPKEFVATKRPNRFGGMGFDHMTVGKTQPARFPGPIHPKTGNLQRLLYIDPSMGY